MKCKDHQMPKRPEDSKITYWKVRHALVTEKLRRKEETNKELLKTLRNARDIVAQYNNSALEMSQDRVISGAILSQVDKAIAKAEEES